jgi:hypothetical protein
MAKNIFMAISIVLWPYLLTTKIRWLQKNNIGHTNSGIELNENTNQRNNTRNSRPNQRNDIRNSRPNQRNDTRNLRPNPTESQPVPPDDPPTYEKAIEENPGLLSSRVLPIAPPSYTESISEIQRQPLTGTED